MDEKLAFQMRLVTKYLCLLKTLGQTPYPEFRDDLTVLGAAERYLQLAIESCLKAGNRILALHQVDWLLETPDSYEDIFRILERQGIIHGLEQPLADFARLRSKLIHNYWDIPPATIYESLQNLTCIEEFLQQISRGDYGNPYWLVVTSKEEPKA